MSGCFLIIKFLYSVKNENKFHKIVDKLADK